MKAAKHRKASRKVICQAIRKQLGDVRRNLAHIDVLVQAGAFLSTLSQQQYRKLLVIHELFRQQQSMYEQHQHRIDDRIVSVSQLYRTRVNRLFCRQHGIRLSGSPLGSPVVNEQAELRKLAQDNAKSH